MRRRWLARGVALAEAIGKPGWKRVARRWFGIACLSPAILLWLALNQEYLWLGPDFSPPIFGLTALLCLGVIVLVEDD